MLYPVVIFGTIAFDNIFEYDKDFSMRFKDYKDKISINFITPIYKKYFGGTASNVAYNLALLNTKCRIMASAGSDFSEYKKWLNNHEINTDWIVEHNDIMTSSCVIVNDRNNNQIELFYPGSMNNDKNLTLYNKNIEGIKLAIISPTDVDAMLLRSQECTALDIPYIFDPGMLLERFIVDDLFKCCTKATVVIMNEFEFDLFLKIANLNFNEAASLFPTLIITRGSNGSTLYNNGNTINIPVVNSKKVKDTTGAGDAYKAGLAFGIINDLSLENCCKIGSTIASFKVETNGSMNHLFTKEEFILRYKTHYDNYYQIEKFTKNFKEMNDT
jgi:Sugar kinases, ribokinase family